VWELTIMSKKRARHESGGNMMRDAGYPLSLNGGVR
jgi:hypothetical protein